LAVSAAAAIADAAFSLAAAVVLSDAYRRLWWGFVNCLHLETGDARSREAPESVNLRTEFVAMILFFLWVLVVGFL
jgi:hypothetical protein